VDNAIRQITDAAGNSGCEGVNVSAVLENDLTVNAICNVSGRTMVDRYEAFNFGWSISNEAGSVGEPVPDFAYFGFEVNLSLLNTAGGPLADNLRATSCGPYIVVDYDPNTVFVSSEVRIYDLLGNLVASPVTNKALKVAYYVADVKKFLGMDTLLNCGSIDPSKFDVIPGQNGAPDKLMMRYPSTLALGYEFMRAAHDRNEPNQVVPSWNCLNSKGRLVAPGGYIVSQTITALNNPEKVTKKIVVTSKRK
jgi:hypothetical protein